MTLVLGVDSSTQSTKAVLVDADDGTVVETGSASHPIGTEVDPRSWTTALETAASGLLDRCDAIAVGGQQHGMVALGTDHQPVRDALLWNDTRSAKEAADLVEEVGGAQACADATGSVYVASYTITKLRWVRDHEPALADRTETVLLPHDYLTWHLGGCTGAPTTDRGDASGTGYYAPAENRWRTDLAERALGRDVLLPRVVAPSEVVGSRGRTVVGAGTGDNMAAALGLGLQPGDVAVSVGTSGVASTVSATPTADGTGLVSGFADATGRYLPLVCTLNAARVLDLAARTLGVDHDRLSTLALESGSGARGVSLLPYLDGERTPNLPDATGTLHGLTSSTTPADIARAAVEGLLCSLADAVDHLVAATGVGVERIVLIGGGARNPAVQRIAPAIFGVPVTVPADGEYVALGAARQAAWALSGAAEPPAWPLPAPRVHEAEPTPQVRDAYAALRDRVHPKEES